VLLRGEMTTSDLAAIIRSVKSQVDIPVTYADVWEYWLRNREVYDAVDFVTIHILPYWEDMPVRAKFAAAMSMPSAGGWRWRFRQGNPDRRDRLAERGRMREGALPSRTNQARIVSEILDLAKRENFRVNLIEATTSRGSASSRHRRRLLGPVRFGAAGAEIPAGRAISNYPYWKLQMGCGMALALFVFGAAWLTLRRRPWTPRLAAWIAVAVSRPRPESCSGGRRQDVLRSYGFGGWLGWGALLAAGWPRRCCAPTR